MSKKSVFGYMGILALSVVVSIILPFVAFSVNNNYFSYGFPLKFTEFSLLGSDTNYLNFSLDVLFYFAVIWAILKIIRLIIKR